MSAFSGIGTALVGGGLGALGSVLGGRSSNRAARDARGFQRENQRLALAYLRAAQFGTLDPSQYDSDDPYTGYPESVSAELKRIDELLANPNLPLKQIKSLAKKRDSVAGRVTRNLPPPSIGETGLRSIYAEDAPNRMAEYDKIFGEQSAAAAKTRQGIQAQLDALKPYYEEIVSQADQFGPAAQASATQQFNDFVSRGTADVTRSASRRGITGGSVSENQRGAIYGQGAGGLAQAFADIEARKAQLGQNARQERIRGLQSNAGALTGFDVNELARQQGALGGRFGLYSGLADRPIQSYERQNAMTASAFNPSALYSNPALATPNATTQNFGNALGGLGGTIAGFGLRSLFEPQQQRAQQPYQDPFMRIGGYTGF